MTDKPNLARLLDGVDMEDVARAIYDAMRFERKDKTPDWVKGGNSNAQVEARATAARILAALSAAMPDLTDPVTVHANMLRGTIAKPTVEQIIHLYGADAFQPMIDAATAKALEKACLAVSEHANWPEDEHGRTEQVGLFARVINAICAIAPAAPHVNETPKREHDCDDVLTVPDLVAEAGKVLEGVTPGPWKAKYSKWEPSNFIVQTDHPCRRVLAKFDGDGDGPDAQSIADARFIAWCREGVPALIALATAQAAQIAGLEAKAESWRSDYRALEKAIVGDTGLSAMTVATQARLFRPRAEAAEAKVKELEAQIVAEKEENRWAYIQAAMDDKQTDAEAEAATLRTEVDRLRGAAKALCDAVEADDGSDHHYFTISGLAKALRAALEGKA